MQNFRNGRDGLYAVFNGGQNAQIPHQLRMTMAGIVMEEFTQQQETGSGSKPLDYLKYSFLTAHRYIHILLGSYCVDWIRDTIKLDCMQQQKK